MKNHEIQIEILPVQDIEEYENNTRQHGQIDIDAIKESIEAFGFNDPIGIWSERNIIVEGHGRLAAAKALGMEEVPCIRLDHLTDEERKAYAIAHNKTAELSEWNFEKLDLELAGIKSIDMSAFGFQVIDEEVDPEDVIEDVPPEEAERRAEYGMIFELGEHRLMCGDSTKKEDLDALMGGCRADFVFTDPPYGVSIGDKNKALNTVQKSGQILDNIENDTLPPDELYKVLVAAFTNLREHASDKCSYYVSSPQGGNLGMMMMMMRDSGLEVRHMLIWVKNSATFSIGRLDYDYKHEPIFYTWTKGHNFYGGYNTTVIDDTADINKMSKAELKEIVRAYIEKEDTTVIYEDKPLKSKLHPTMKPVKLVARLMHNSSRAGDVCVDIFGGSGTTMIAAEQLKRRCFMMELDPHYCDVIIARWEAFTGQKAKQIKA